jgi:hypothetical protein
MREITQSEAAAMRTTLKEIASFGNEGADQSEPGQAAARRARSTLEDLGLFFEADANAEPGRSSS